ncbi:MAG TPA: hypothetical protein VGG64_04460 [Pirellulales bacterium]|jgi:hypothetical protein
MNVFERVRLLIVRARAKTGQQLLRGIAMRLWPLSILTRMYYRIRWAEWPRAFLNRDLIAAFAHEPPVLDGDQQRCVDELRKTGIYASTLQELTGDNDLLGRLTDEAQKLLAAPAVQAQIAERHARRGEKWYVIRPLGYESRLTLSEPLAQLVLHPRLLAIVNQYLGMYSRLCYVGLWYNIPVFDQERGIDSENWHRDHEDRNVLKLYLYLVDVDDQMGPLNYLRGTQPLGPYADAFPAEAAYGSIPTPEQLTAVVPCEANLTCTGPAGTLLFCDTAGFHRGGRTLTKPRVVFTATYVTDSGVDVRRIELERAAQLHDFGVAAAFALRKEKQIRSLPAR